MVANKVNILLPVGKVTSYLAEMNMSRGIHNSSPVSVVRGSDTSSEALSDTRNSNAGSSMTSGMLYDTSAYNDTA